MASKKNSINPLDAGLVQQGDVLFHPVAELPKGLKKVTQKFPGQLTVAEGEHSGHHHSCLDEETTELFTDENGTLWLSVAGESTTFTHQEHKPVNVKKGCYKIGQVREMDHLQETIRSVQD